MTEFLAGLLIVVLSLFLYGAPIALGVLAYLRVRPPKPLEVTTTEYTVVNGEDVLRFSFLSGQTLLLPLAAIAHILGPPPDQESTDAVSSRSIGFVDFDEDTETDKKGTP